MSNPTKATCTVDLYFEVWGIVHNDDGNKAPAGTIVSFETSEEPSAVAEKLRTTPESDIIAFAFPSICILGDDITMADIHVITPEKYNAEYASDREGSVN